MSQATTSSKIVEAFKDLHNFAQRIDDKDDDNRLFPTIEGDGKVWVERDNRVVTLIDGDIETWGLVDCTQYSECEYVETRSVNEYQGYVFTAGDYENIVDVKQVRTLANDVFDIEYSEMKECAKTIDNAEIEGCPKGEAPVLFDVPNTSFTVMVSPLITDDD